MRISRDEALALFHQNYPAKIVVWPERESRKSQINQSSTSIVSLSPL
jgi:hypothetical protein